VWADIQPVVGPCSRRGQLARQGAGRWKFGIGQRRAEKGGTARRDKNRRSRVASLKLRPGSAASPVERATIGRLAIRARSATRSRF
jgi:hypothetical protein